MARLKCTKCGHQKSWKVRRQKRVCMKCRHKWDPKYLPLRLTRDQWKQIIKWFVLEQSSNRIEQLTGINRKRILRALTHARIAMAKDVPEVFSGIVEVDETYVGGEWKNKRKSVRAKGTKHERGTSKQSVFDIYCRSGLVLAEIVDDVEAQTLQPLIQKQVKRGSTINSDTWRGSSGNPRQETAH